MHSAASRPALPDWASQLVALYESDAASQFVLYGNVQDRFRVPAAEGGLVELTAYFTRVLLPRFDVVLSYDLGNGIRVEKGGELLAQWPGLKETAADLPRAARPAIEWLTRYLRYCANLARLGKERVQVAVIIKAANLVAPAVPGSHDHELHAMALLMREWSSEALLAEHALATFLLTENLNDLHPLLATNPRAARVKIPLPGVEEIEGALRSGEERYAGALAGFSSDLPKLAAHLAGTTLNAVESLLKLKQYRREALSGEDLSRLRKQLVEEECQGLIEFIEPRRSLEDLHGQEKLKAWLRQDLALWKSGDLRALPMGYLVCGPVGTGKTYLVECLAGEAGVPVVKIRNFRDKWVGSTEGNLEKIFRLLQALNRCYVFIDEADQALGRRDSGGNDSGLSGRIYSMMAAEMSRPENRGRIIWVLASSRPDLIEVDLKRPGRVDVKIPIFPTSTAEESWHLLRALARRYDLELDESNHAELRPRMPLLLTPGAAEALALKIYRDVHANGRSVGDSLRGALETYQNPVPPEIMEAQIRLAVAEASDLEFVPTPFRSARPAIP
ncbi:MAG: AAA family ATPase [Chthoniobacteraceae bacterium]